MLLGRHDGRDADELLTPFERLCRRVEDAETYHLAHHDQCRDFWNYYCGEGQDRSDNLPEELQSDWVTTNFTYSTIEQYVAVLMQGQPAWFVVAAESEREDAATKATEWLQAYYHEANVPFEQEMCYRYALVMGTGALKVYFDKGEDDVQVRAVDPTTIFPEPSAKRFDQCSFVAIRNVYGLDLAEKMFEKFKRGDEGIELVGVEEDEPEGDTKPEDRVVIWEVYHKFGKRLTIYSGSKNLYDGKNPTPGGAVPLLLFPFDADLVGIWGTSLVKHIQGLQDLFNKTRSRVSVNIRYTANPKMKTTDPALTDVDVNPGSLITIKTPGGDVEDMVPPPMPAYVMNLLDQIPSDMDSITGVHEITRGVRPTGTTSGISLEVLHQAAQTRLAGPAGKWTSLMAKIGELVLKLMQKYYGESRSIPYLDGTETKRATIAPSDLSTVELQGEGAPAYQPTVAPDE